MATYNITNLVPNVTSGNKSITIQADDGYNLPSSVSVSGGTLVSYNSSTGVAVISGDNAVVNATCVTNITPYITFSSRSSFTLKTSNRTKRWNGTLEYSTNAQTWTVWDGTTTLSSTSTGTVKYLYLGGSNNTYITGDYGTYRWVLYGSNIACEGNIETLLDYQTVLAGNHPTMANYCYGSLFQDCTELTTAPELSATSLSPCCYSWMFRGCISLTTAPNLPATILAGSCYNQMFYGCTQLTTAPALPATTLAKFCYDHMFYGCTELTTAPALPATTLAQSCYDQMFYGCTKLTIPAIMARGTIQATSAKECCRGMYYGCTSLSINNSSGTAFYKALTYSTSSSNSKYRASYQMFYNCKINGTTSTDDYLTAGTQYYC